MQEVNEVQQEVTDLVQLLTSRQAELASMLNGFPQLRSTIWFSEASQQAAVQSLTPQMTENRGKVIPPPLPTTPPLGPSVLLPCLHLMFNTRQSPFTSWIRAVAT